GYAVGAPIVSTEEIEDVVAEREAAVAELEDVETLATDTLTVLRSEWFESIGGETYLNIEAKSSAGADSSTVLTVSWDGNSETMSRFVDAGQYMYHRFSEPVQVDDIPDEVTITSSMGGETTADVVAWLGEPRKPDGPHYATAFVDHYMDPTEVYQRIEDLAAEFPDLTEIIELPYQTNGYRRHAQALIGSFTSTAF